MGTIVIGNATSGAKIYACGSTSALPNYLAMNADNYLFTSVSGSGGDIGEFNTTNVTFSKPLRVSSIGTVSGDLTISPAGDCFVEESLKVYESADKTKFVEMSYDTTNSKAMISTSNKTTAPLSLVGGTNVLTDSNISLGYVSTNYCTIASDDINFGSIGVANDYAIMNATNITLKKPLIATGVSVGTVVSGGWIGLDSSNNVVKGNPISGATLPLGSITTANDTYIPYSNGTNLVESANFKFVYNSLDISNGSITTDWRAMRCLAGSISSGNTISIQLKKDDTHYADFGYKYDTSAPYLNMAFLDGSTAYGVTVYKDRTEMGPKLNVTNSSASSATMAAFYQASLGGSATTEIHIGKSTDDACKISYELDSNSVPINSTIEFVSGTAIISSIEMNSNGLKITNPAINDVTATPLGIDGSGNVVRMNPSSIKYKTITNDKKIIRMKDRMLKLTPLAVTILLVNILRL